MPRKKTTECRFCGTALNDDHRDKSDPSACKPCAGEYRHHKAMEKEACNVCGALFAAVGRGTSNKYRCADCARKLNTKTMREWRRKNRDKVNRQNTLRRYGGVDPQVLLAAQGGQCAICGTIDPGKRGWATDHDHSCCSGNGNTCGECVRGVLCGSCNTGLGMFGDSVVKLASAIEYLSNKVR